MFRFARLFAAAALIATLPIAHATAQEQTLTVFRRRVDEERTRRRQRRLHQGERRQDRRQLCREFGLGQADGKRRAGRRLYFRRSAMDGLRRAEKI